MKSLLVLFGWCAVITSLLIIFVPYMRRRTDLITGWTLFQVSCANFLGVASIQSGQILSHLYVNPMPEDYVKFVMGGTVFYIVSILTYYYFGLPQKLADRVLRKTGPRAVSVLMIFVPICLAMTLGYLFVPQIQFLGQWMVALGRPASIIGMAFCMVIWAQRPFNVSFALLFALVLFCAMTSATSEFGRRDFLSALMTLPICWYWLRGRYYNPARVLVIAGVFAVIAFMGVAGLSIARGMRANPDLNVIQAAWAKLKTIPEVFSKPGGTEGVFGGDPVEASLTAIRLYDSVQATQPFFSLKYMLVHPIPRAWWPTKPLGLGYSLPRDVGYSRAHGSAANIGPGVVGHGYHEGGLFYIAFYAWLFASAVRWFDTILSRDPTNPYVLGAFGAFSGNLVALTRGEIGLFAAIIVGTWLAAMLFNYLGRIFFWTDYIQTPEEAAQAAANQPEYNWAEPASPHAETWRI